MLCLEEDIPALEEIIFAETTTIGIRRVRMERSILKRHIYTIPTSLGDVEVKMCLVPHCNGNEVFERMKSAAIPSMKSIKAICKRTGRSYQDVTRQVLRELARKQGGLTMHMADALLAPGVAGVMYACSAVAAGRSVRKLNQQPDDKAVPVMGVDGCLCFCRPDDQFYHPRHGVPAVICAAACCWPPSWVPTPRF